MTLTQTSRQVRRIGRLGSDAIEKVLEELKLDEDGAHRIHEHSDEFVAAISAAARTSLLDLSVSDRFVNEEVKSSYEYPQGYHQNDLTTQTNRLRQLFPDIGFADENLSQAPLPKGAEGWFAIPRWEKFGATYQEALEKVLAKIKEIRLVDPEHYCESDLGPKYLRQTDRTVLMMKKLADAQPDHDILVVAAQFGLRHRGRSVRRAREVFTASEFGLGAFAVGIMSLTHSERFVRWEQLYTDCAGDEYSPNADGSFFTTPVFHWRGGGGLTFVGGWFGHVLGRFGSVSAFLPQ